MVKAFKEVFPESVMLTCFKHIKDNLSRHLTKNTKDKEDCPSNVKSKILTDFGKLCENSSKSQFDLKAKEFEQKYSKYFTERFFNSLMEKVTKKIVNPHVLDESLPEKFYNNESG